MIQMTLMEFYLRWNEFQPRIQSGELQISITTSIGIGGHITGCEFQLGRHHNIKHIPGVGDGMYQVSGGSDTLTYSGGATVTIKNKD